jgi:hypothetical protein
MNNFIWFLETPNHWIRCSEIRSTIGGVVATLYGGKIVSNLHKRQIDGATIVQ